MVVDPDRLGCSQRHCAVWERLRETWNRGIRDEALQTNMLFTCVVSKVRKCITSLAASSPFNSHNGSVEYLEVSGGLVDILGHLRGFENF